MQLHIEDLYKIRQFVLYKKCDSDLENTITETIDGCIENAETFLEKEKQQIIDSHKNGSLTKEYNGSQTSEQYYSETFNNND